MMRGGALINHIESHKMFTERDASKVVQGVTSAIKHLHGQGITQLILNMVDDKIVVDRLYFCCYETK